MVLKAADPTMSSANRAAAVIPPWLRSTIVALVAGLDGDGLDGALARTFAESCKSSMSNGGTEVSQDARALVGEAIKHLSSTDEGGRIPLSTCASAIRALSQALEVIASPSVPTLPSGYPSIIQNGIPLEVLHNIFQTALASIDDYREHQQFMMSMALVSRSFHAAIAPTLRKTVHITSAAQLSGLQEALASDEERVSQLNTVYVDLDIQELEWRDGKPWHGRQLGPVLDLLAPNVRRAFVRLRMRETPPDELSDFEGALRFATGTYVGRVSQLSSGQAFANATELHLERLRQHPLASNPCAIMLMPPPTLTRLYLDTEGVHFHDLELSSDFISSKAVRHPWTVLAVPFHAFLLLDFSRFLTIRTCTLRHLETTFLLHEPTSSVIADLTTLFLYLAPTLVHLTLRLDGRGTEVDANSVLESLPLILIPCAELDSFEVGCRAPDIKKKVAAACVDNLPVRRITFLPFIHDSGRGWSQLSLSEQLFERGIHPDLVHLTVVIEPENDHFRSRTHPHDISSLMDKFETLGVGLTIKRREQDDGYGLDPEDDD